MSQIEIQIGCDIGGTFTDIVARIGDGELHVRKLASTPDEPGKAVISGLTDLLRELGADFKDVKEIVHGTTVGSNTILQKSGARTGLITTQGFRDVLEIGRIRTPTMFDLTWEKPEPLVPRRHRLEINERIGAGGEIIRPLVEEEVISAAEFFVTEGIEAVAICYINSCVNPANERATLKILEDKYPELLTTASCDVLPEMKEYERTSTTVVNAYLLVEMRNYLTNLTTNLANTGMIAPLLVVASSGGMMRVNTASEVPVFAVGSGPAGGVMGAARLAQSNGQNNAIAFDMGGTTAKAAIIEAGEPMITSEYEFRDGISAPSRFIKGGGYMLKVPSIDIAEVGAGGGSIASIDEGGLLKVGPLSAGADPGPACYGNGNEHPTVTDANLVLGYLNPEGLVGGSLGIDSALSEKAIMAHIGLPLGLSLIEAAKGIHRIANVAMARAIRSVTIERGRDPREMVLIAFGGSGPVHAVGVAALLGIKKVIIPAMSGVFCSVGMLASDVEHNLVRSFPGLVNLLSVEDFCVVLRELGEEGKIRLGSDGFSPEDMEFFFGADMRYFGQSSELTVPFDLKNANYSNLEFLISSFQKLYEKTFGYRNEEDIELVNIRLLARGVRLNRLSFHDLDQYVRTANIKQNIRNVWFADSQAIISTPTFSRDAVSSGPISGPAILESYDTTIVVPPNLVGRADGCGSVVIELSNALLEG